MRRLAWFLAFSGLLPHQAAGQRVPEGIHSIVKGPSEICGITATTAVEFESRVRAAPKAKYAGQTDQFIIYEGPAESTQWVFAKATYFAYPMATCRRVFVRNGATHMGRQMRCDDSREDCDKAFLEFNDLDQRAIQSIRQSTRP